MRLDASKTVAQKLGKLSFYLTISCLIPFTFVSSVKADDAFQAVVNSDTAHVHSGPDANDYYPTQQLKRGDKVKVVREDFGGWYMITPPENSFSWIRADFVEQTGKQGVVKVDNAVDRIGSTVHDGESFVVHRLSQGATVKIIGEEDQVDKNGMTVKMLKIKPPNGEFRYINKRDVVAAEKFAAKDPGLQPELLPGAAERKGTISIHDSPGATQITPDPFADPPKANDLSNGPSIPLPADDLSIPGSPANRLPGSASEGVKMPPSTFDAPEPLTVDGSSPAPESQNTKQAWAMLERIDERFRLMIKQPVSQWKIETVRSDYQKLDGLNSSRMLDRQITLRLEAVGRYQRLSDEYAAVRRIVSETERRDNEIRKSFLSRRQTVSMHNAPRTQVVRETPGSTQPANVIAPRNTIAAPGIQPPSPQPSLRSIQRPANSRFDGAGIIRKVRPRRGYPEHVLITPDGRLLAYLQAVPGVDLDRYVGRSFGLNGPRAFRPDLNADFITVRRLTAVRLSR